MREVVRARWYEGWLSWSGEKSGAGMVASLELGGGESRSGLIRAAELDLSAEWSLVRFREQGAESREQRAESREYSSRPAHLHWMRSAGAAVGCTPDERLVAS